jgi:hypothetical protein
MITNPVSCYLECLQMAGIQHSAFIESNKVEVHLWQMNKFGEALQILDSRGITIDSVVKQDDFYIIRF